MLFLFKKGFKKNSHGLVLFDQNLPPKLLYCHEKNQQILTFEKLKL